MEKLPLISVILPVYKVEDRLEKCVESVLNQSYQNIEVILVDDGSPDRCGEICDSFAQKDRRVKVIHQENGGLSAARNSGIENAAGEYLAFVDSDDYVAEDFISFLYTLLSENGAEISACGNAVVHASGRIEADRDVSIKVMDSREALRRMCYNDLFYVTTWDKLYKRSLFDGIRFPEGKLFEDTGTTYKLVDRAEKIVSCREVKYYYIYDATSITNCAFHEKKLDYVEMADNMASFIEEKYPDLKRGADRKRLHARFSTLMQLCSSPERRRDIEKKLIAELRPLQGGVFFDPSAPVRDKIAILSLLFGFPAFAFAWRVFRKLKK